MKNSRLIARTAVVLLLPFIIAAAEFSDYTTLINQKMETERRLEQHLTGIISKVVGEDKFTVIVNVELSDMKKSRVQTEQWLEEEKKKNLSPARQEEFLPGIPLRSKIEEKDDSDKSPGKSGGKKIEDILTLPAEFIKSLRVSLIIDKRVPDETVATVEKVISDIVNLNPARGDRLTIQRVDFANRKVDFISFLFNPYFYIITLVLITLALIGFFLFGPLKKFLFATLQTMKELKGIKSETEVSGAGGGGGGGITGVGGGLGGEYAIEEMEEEDVEAAEGAEESDEESSDEATAAADGEYYTDEEREFEKMTYRPLKFLEDRDLKKLAYLLSFENSEVGALLIDYLQPEKGAKVLAALPIDKRIQVAKSIVKIQRSSKEIMEHVDDFLSRKINYVSGGADKLVSFIEMMNEEDREKLIDALTEDDPEFAEKIQGRIFSFDDIVNLDDAAVQMLIQELETKDLGVALRNVSDEIQEKFISNMSEGAAALLKEEIEFGRKVTETQTKAKQVEIIGKIKQLENEGLITGVAGVGSEELWEEELGTEEKEGVLEKIIEAANQALVERERLQNVAAAKEPEPEGQERDEEAFKYYELGLEAYKDEDYESAIRYFNRSLHYNSAVWQTHQYIGSCYLALGDDDHAKEAYSMALELNPENAELAEWLREH